MKSDARVYVSGALSDLPQETAAAYKDLYRSIGKLIEDQGLKAYVPQVYSDPGQHPNMTPAQVDQIDRTAVMSSILVIAVVDVPSLGVGIEVEMAYHAAKSVLLVCHEDRLKSRRVSRLVLGNPAVKDRIVYSDREDCLDKIGAFLERFVQEMRSSILPAALKP